MNRSDRSLRAQARPTARARRIAAAAAGEGGTQIRVPYRPREGGSRRRRSSLKRRLGLLLGVVLLITIFGGVVLWGRVSAFNERVSTAPAPSTSLLLPLNGSDRVNVLMIGYGGEQSPNPGSQFLADSINILSIDPHTDTTTIIPVPRDLWIEGFVEMPNNGKVNEVFALGYLNGGLEEAGRAMSAVLSQVTGLSIEHWMAIDFAGFAEMVDAVGGVTIENPTAFQYTWDEGHFNDGLWSGGAFAAGTLELNGEQALSYARTRYTSEPSESSDFARSIRQQRIMGALRSKLGEGGLSSIGPGLRLMDALEGRLVTDLSAIDLFLLSGHINADRRIELSEDIILQAGFNDLGQYVLVVIGRSSPSDYGPLQAYLAGELARPMETEPAVEPAAGS